MNDFTEHPLKLVGLAERNGDLFLLFDGEPGQHVFHQRTGDAEEWAAFTECSVGSITAREVYEAARPHLDRAANSLTTTDFREQARQLAQNWLLDTELYGIEAGQSSDLAMRIASALAEAATQGQAGKDAEIDALKYALREAAIFAHTGWSHPTNWTDCEYPVCVDRKKLIGDYDG